MRNEGSGHDSNLGELTPTKIWPCLCSEGLWLCHHLPDSHNLWTSAFKLSFLWNSAAFFVFSEFSLASLASFHLPPYITTRLKLICPTASVTVLWLCQACPSLIRMLHSSHDNLVSETLTLTYYPFHTLQSSQSQPFSTQHSGPSDLCTWNNFPHP